MEPGFLPPKCTCSGDDVSPEFEEYYDGIEKMEFDEKDGLTKPTVPENQRAACFGADWARNPRRAGELSAIERLTMMRCLLWLFETILLIKGTLTVVEVNAGSKSAALTTKNAFPEVLSGMHVIASDLFSKTGGIAKEPAHTTVKGCEEPIEVIVSFKPPPNQVFGPDLAATHARIAKGGPFHLVVYGEMGASEGSSNFWRWMKLWKMEHVKTVALHHFYDRYTDKTCWKCIHILKYTQ